MVRFFSLGSVLVLAALAASMVILPPMLPPLPPPPLMFLLFPVGLMAALMFLAFSPTEAIDGDFVVYTVWSIWSDQLVLKKEGVVKVKVIRIIVKLISLGGLSFTLGLLVLHFTCFVFELQGCIYVVAIEVYRFFWFFEFYGRRKNCIYDIFGKWYSRKKIFPCWRRKWNLDASVHDVNVRIILHFVFSSKHNCFWILILEKIIGHNILKMWCITWSHDFQI